MQNGRGSQEVLDIGGENNIKVDHIEVSWNSWIGFGSG
jgi:hypothetical protein